MLLIVTGCEHVGKTTLANGISRWLADATGYSRSFHDHFTIPSPEVADADREHFMAMSPAFKERFQRYQMDYHTHGTFLGGADHMLVGFHIEEAVFAPLYHDYGGPGQPGDRSSFARRVEQRLMASSPDFILVLLKARPEVIVQRMRDEPMPRDQKGRRPGLLEEKDVEYVLQRFDEEFGRSLIRRKFIIDNSDLTSEETLSEFVFKVQKYLSQSDRMRILTRQAMAERGDARDPVFEGDKTVPPEQRVKL
jgi:thymidylate kinase